MSGIKPSLPRLCDVCGKSLKKQYQVLFNRVCCSDVCAATLYDQEYDLPSGTTLNEILYRQLLQGRHGERVGTKVKAS